MSEHDEAYRINAEFDAVQSDYASPDFAQLSDSEKKKLMDRYDKVQAEIRIKNPQDGIDSSSLDDPLQRWESLTPEQQQAMIDAQQRN